MTTKYTYLKSRDVMRTGDEYHQCGLGKDAIWILVGRASIGHLKGEFLSHATRVRRATKPVPEKEQGELF